MAPDRVSNLPAFKVLAGVSTLAFPVMLLTGFLLHPDLLSLDITKSLDTWIPEWRDNPGFHWGHLLVMLTPPLVIASVLHQVTGLRGRNLSIGFWGPSWRLSAPCSWRWTKGP